MIRLLFLLVTFIYSISAHAEQRAEQNAEPNATPHATQSTAPKILILGDSISAEFGLKKNQGWVSLLQQRLISKEYPHKVINASISGDTSSGGLRRISTALDTHKPVCVIIELGANDGLRGLKLSQLKTNLSHITDLSLNKQAKVLILGMRLPPNYGPAYTLAFSDTFLEVSKNKQVSIVPFLFAGFESDLTYFQTDRIHPNANAQMLILNNIWPALSPLLQSN